MASAVSFLLREVSVMLRDEYKLLGGLKREVEYFRDEFGQMNEFLRVADESDSNVEWIKQLREITYDIEDVLDRYMLQFRPLHGKNMFKKVYNDHQIASVIKDIKYRLQNVSKSQKRYIDICPNMDQGSSSTPPIYVGGGNALFMNDDEVVGREEPKEQLLEWIRSTHGGRLEVISVVGMGGLGKTTLVKKVYDNGSVKRHFNHHVWIVASNYKSVEHMSANLIEKLVAEINEPPPQNLGGMNLDDMKEFIYEFLKGKSYIIVLDDVWSISTWDAIRYAFPGNQNTHGCVIITTRFFSIANAACCETDHMLELEPLLENESRNLFYKKAFPRRSCHSHIRDQFAENILKRCEGLPLAISVISGLLATKDYSADEWEKLERSLGHELKGGGSLEKLGKSIFSLSYNGLPYYLKYFYLYLSIFPEDVLLEKETIIRLWIAEGFVQQEDNKTKEEVALDYLNDLFNRSLIQVAQRHIDGRVRAFRIHNLLRDCIVSKLGELNIVTIFNGGKMQCSDIVRRLAIQKKTSFSQETFNFDSLRSLLSLCSEEIDIAFIKELLVGRCRLIKVLDLRGAPLENIPDGVFKLYHLKYLSLRGTMVKHVPKSIKYLDNLETLDLKNCNVTELPKEILELHKLQHLLVYRYIGITVLFDNIQSCKAPRGIGNMKSLLKLCCINASESGGMKMVSEIGKLTQLRRLGIAKLRNEDGKDLCSSIVKLTSLRSLRIDSDEKDRKLDLDYTINFQFLRSLTLKGHMDKLPKWISSLNELTTLCLFSSRLRKDPLKSLQDLPNLAKLDIHGAYIKGLEFEAHKFKKLKELWLRELKCMTQVIVGRGSMIILHEWTMKGCKLLKRLPRGIEHLPKLQVLNFVNMADEFADRVDEAKRNGDINWRLAHVSVSI